jgi:DNA-binding IclR family transcriptional regulator
MDEYSLPPEVQRLIAETLESMDHLEVLFHISQQPEATAELLAEKAHIEPARLARVLRDLEHSKLIADEQGVYCITHNSRDRLAVELLAEAYNARPVTLIRAVYARPTPLRSFADAFRLRREDGK